jgi:hypothetical protein
MRRDGGCGERDSRSVEGRQGHDPGGPIDADDVRPLTEMRAATSRMAPGACEDRQPASGCTLSFWGPTGRGSCSGGSLCGDRLSRQAGCPGTACRSIRPVWLAVMFMEHDRECPSPRCCGVVQWAGAQVLRSRRRRQRCIWSDWGKMREHSFRGSSREEERGLSALAQRSSADRSRRRDCGRSPLRGRWGRIRVSPAEW